MKKIHLVSLGAIALFPILFTTPVRAQFQQISQSIVQTLQRPQLELELTAAKQVITLRDGATVTTWEALGQQPVVHPGDTLRYTLTSKNVGDRPANQLVLTQPIPDTTTYVLNSAKGLAGSQLTYSIDGGKTFTANPLIQVKQADGSLKTEPAPADAYTHIRWDLGNAINSSAVVQVTYDLTVK